MFFPSLITICCAVMISFKATILFLQSGCVRAVSEEPYSSSPTWCCIADFEYSSQLSLKGYFLNEKFFFRSIFFLYWGVSMLSRISIRLTEALGLYLV